MVSTSQNVIVLHDVIPGIKANWALDSSVDRWAQILSIILKDDLWLNNEEVLLN